jgi:DNA repair protein RadC
VKKVEKKMNGNGSLKRLEELTQLEKIRLFKKLQEDILQVKESIQDFKKTVTSQNEVIKYFRTVADINKEEVFVLYLDAKNNVIDFEKISEGTLNQSLLYPREIVKRVLEVGALSVILCHNHPSGITTPSENDRKITRKTLIALKETDTKLLDHIIIGNNEKYFSFYEEGLIAKYETNYKYAIEKLNSEVNEI